MNPLPQAKVQRSDKPTWPLSDETSFTFQRDGFKLTPVPDRPFVLELFAGSGRLTRTLRARGLDAWAIDWVGGRLQRETRRSS